MPDSTNLRFPILVADENGVPLPGSDVGSDYAICHECGARCGNDLRRGEDDERYCGWCYDSTGQDPGAFR